MRRLLGLLLALQLIRGLLYAGIIPLWQNPDEYVHFEYVKLLAERDRVRLDLDRGRSTAYRVLRLLGHQDPPPEVAVTRSDLQREIEASLARHEFRKFRLTESRLGIEEMEIFREEGREQLDQPPLYYLLAAQLLRTLRLDSIDQEAYALRVLSVLLSLVVVALAFQVGRELLPDRPLLAVAIAAFVTLLPQYTALSAAIGNDKLAELAFGGVFWLAVRGARRGFSAQTWGALAALAVGGFLIKRTALAFAPFLLLLWDLGRWVRTGRGWGRYLLTRLGFAVAVVALLLVAVFWADPAVEAGLLPQWVSSAVLPYAGYSLEAYSERLRHATRLVPLIARYLPRDAHILFLGFWGNFGHMEVRLGNGLYALLALVTAGAVGGLGLWLRASEAEPGYEVQAWQRYIVVFFLAAAILMVSALFMRDTVDYVMTEFFRFSQSRYLYPVLIPIATCFVLGLAHLFRRAGDRRVLVGLVLGLAVLDAVALLHYVLPFFYGVTLLGFL